jgi:hypothetical protein
LPAGGKIMADQTSVKENETTKIQLNKIFERFGHLRIINPQADKTMLQSMEKYGQKVEPFH